MLSQTCQWHDRITCLNLPGTRCFGKFQVAPCLSWCRKHEFHLNWAEFIAKGEFKAIVAAAWNLELGSLEREFGPFALKPCLCDPFKQQPLGLTQAKYWRQSRPWLALKKDTQSSLWLEDKGSNAWSFYLIKVSFVLFTLQFRSCDWALENRQ